MQRFVNAIYNSSWGPSTLYGIAIEIIQILLVHYWKGVKSIAKDLLETVQPISIFLLNISY